LSDKTDICPIKRTIFLSLPMKEIFISAIHQKVLAFLCEHPTGRFYDRELARSISGVGKTQVNKILKDLNRVDLIHRKREGKHIYNSLNFEHPLIRRFKAFLNILDLFPFLEDLRKVVDKIVLYGSVTDGSNREESDVDILVVTERPAGEIQKILEKHGLEEKVQLVLKTRVEYLALKGNEPVFYDEVHRGIVYYECGF